MIGCEEVLEETPRKATAVIQCDTIVYWAPTEVLLDFFKGSKFIFVYRK